MKEHIIRAILYQDMSVKWKDAEQSGDVNVHLNVHQKARQFVEVELGDFLLSDGETILASFERTIQGDIYHENPAKMDSVEDESCVYRIKIPTLVHNMPGEWGVQFFVVSGYNPATEEYEFSYPSDKAKFCEGSSFIDDGLTVPSKENLSALYKASVASAESAEAAADSAMRNANAAEEARNAAQSALDNIENTQLAYVGKDDQGGNEYDLSFGNGATVRFTAPQGSQGAPCVVGAQGHATFYVANNHLYARILKGTENPYRIDENGHLILRIVKEV